MEQPASTHDEAAFSVFNPAIPFANECFQTRMNKWVFHLFQFKTGEGRSEVRM